MIGWFNFCGILKETPIFFRSIWILRQLSVYDSVSWLYIYLKINTAQIKTYKKPQAKVESESKDTKGMQF